MNRKDEAAAAAKNVLDGTDNTGLLNDAAYVLAETGLDLPYAEEVSRRNIKLLEEKSASITTAEVNSNAFAQANLLLASWDTLGWILFRENKLDEALPWIVAGWRNTLRPQAGDHLGQLYEALDQKALALSVYQLAEFSIDRDNVTHDVYEHITRSLARLSSPGTESSPDGILELQNSRTYKIPRPESVSGWGTFRLQLAAAGVIESQQMSGEQKLANMTHAINAMKFPDLVPPESKAHLLRSAVLSCSMAATCELVLVPNSSLWTEQQ